MDAVSINTRWCKGCGVCVAFCPRKAQSLVNDKAVCNGDLCIACGMCELYCPDLAISVDTTKRAVKPAKEAAS